MGYIKRTDNILEEWEETLDIVDLANEIGIKGEGLLDAYHDTWGIEYYMEAIEYLE